MTRATGKYWKADRLSDLPHRRIGLRGRSRGVGRWALIPLAVLLSMGAWAQENDDCLMCHGDDELSGMRDGAEISMYVDGAALGESMHADLECVMCHQDLSGEDLPHADDLLPVDCGLCHSDQAEDHTRSLHGQAAARQDPLAPSCADCHGSHDIQSHLVADSPTALMNIPLLCGRCHHEGTEVSELRDIPQDRILENYSLSIHGEGLFRKGLTVTAVCTSCHTACVDCHSPHRVRKVFYTAGAANQDCLRCHGQPDLQDREGRSLFVDEAAYSASEHSGTACAQCHTEVQPALERACEAVVSPVDCGICHAGPVADFAISLHGELFAQGDLDAPSCLDCHDRHATLASDFPASPTYPRNVPALCADCHREGEKAARRIDAEVDDIIESYVMSIHGKGLMESGLVVTATCDDCHTAHRALPPSDPRSSVHADNVAGTCGTCHHGIEEIFKSSIHWPGNGESEEKLPTCEDCHSSHTISRVDQDDFRLRMMDQCGRCHHDEAETFFETFHGKVSRLGSTGAAKCYDCHGTHDILPTTDPTSRLSRNRVVETCGQCHGSAHRRFAGYLTHATHHDADRYPWLFWTFWAMTVLLVGTLSFALLHTLAWLLRLWLTRSQWKRHKPAPGEKLYRRFDRVQRTMHLVMIISFFTLALTGMALKFSYMGWASVLARMLGGFESMGVLHRLGAVALFVLFAFHIGQVLRRKRASGRSWGEELTGPNSMLFHWRDLRQAAGSLKWFFGLGPRPEFGRYTYWEKFDYFAVFWGVLVIGSTGLILWFPELFTYIVPGWFVNVATIIHSDEALLAVAFIFTIHFFNTHFRPDKFPMDPVIFTGRMTLEELRYDKPQEYAEMEARGEMDRYLVDPLPRSIERGMKVFGALALVVGLALIGLIIYAMLFGYQ
jgi:cytochrome b subunit of formate dehydrogenase